MNQYCQNVLKAEIAKPDYDGMTADQGWAWLMEPRTETRVVPTNETLTPRLAAKAIGPAKANALMGKIKQALPNIGVELMTGVNVSDQVTVSFLTSMIDASVVAKADIDKLIALGTKTETVEYPRRFDRRFDPELWPHVDNEGNVGGEDDPAINGFPNTISRVDFDAAWQAAGRA